MLNEAPHSYDTIGPIDEICAFFDARASEWDTHSRIPGQVLASVLDAARIQEGMRVLDIACGTGVLFPGILSCAPSLVRAIDVSPTMISLASNKVSDDRVILSVQDFYTFCERGFDRIFVYNAYPHFLDKKAFTAKIKECLAPGGRFVLAHGRGRDLINQQHHDESEACRISTPLLSCQEEVGRFDGIISFDTMIDDPDMYLLAGVKVGY